VVGSAARRGLQGFFIGSVAETILSKLRRSALVLKRPGFVSPVRGRK
jgi:nucleotide-binding universal stress UspA family protein